MATHGRGRITRTLLGSVTEQVLRDLHEPVLLVGPGFEHDRAFLMPNEVVVALDGSPAAERIIPAAIAWADWLGADLQCVQVAGPHLPLAGPPGILVEPALESVYLRRLAVRNGRIRHWDVLHGDDPARVLADRAARPGTLLAMSSHGRSGIARTAMGSVAMSVAHAARGPMLVPRPDGSHA